MTSIHDAITGQDGYKTIWNRGWRWGFVTATVATNAIWLIATWGSV